MNEYLNPAEKEKVIAFVNDTAMFEAVKKVLMEPMFGAGVLKPGEPGDFKNWAYRLTTMGDTNVNDEHLGQLLRAASKGLGFLETGFEKLKEYKPQPVEDKEADNEAL